MLGSLSMNKIKRTWSLPLKIYNIGVKDPYMNSFTLLEKSVSYIIQDWIRLMWELRVRQIPGSVRF